MDELATLTRDLVSIPSHEDETEAGDFIEDWLAAETAGSVERDQHGNVIARRGSGPESLALVGHHDVVPPDESQVDGDEYVVDREGDRLFGRGAADMKGAVAAMLCAFRDADRGGHHDEADGPAVDQLVFVSFVGEEIGGVGARGAIADGFVPDYAVVGEGSTDYSKAGVTDVAIAHRGRRAVTIEAAGTAAHASEPEAGENAIYRASDAVDVVRDLPVPATTVLGHDVEGSIAVTEIEGGSAWNVIPERCTVTVDERTVPDERAELSGLAAIPGVDWTVDQDLPPMACRDDAFAEAVLSVNRSVHGAAAEADAPGEADAGPAGEADAGMPEEVVKPHATDAGWLSEAGTTCVVCGPAEPAQAHTADESVSIDVLERCYRIYRGVAEACVVGEG